MKLRIVNIANSTVLALIVLIVSSVIALRDLFASGYFESHDGIIHVMRLAHFDEALTSGQFPVRWLSSWMAGYGSPVFNFIWSLPYYIGSLIHNLGISYQSSTEVVFFLGSLLSVIFCFLFIKELLRNNLAAFVGSFLYIWAPYRFTDIFIRGAFGEAMTFLFFPLLFWFILKAFRSSRKIFPLSAGIIFGLFIISHNILSMFGIGLFFLYVIYLEFLNKTKLRVLKSGIFIFLLGLGLSAFYWLPAILESDQIEIYKYLTNSFQNQFPSIAAVVYSPWQYAYSVPQDQKYSMSFQLGIVQLIILLLLLPTMYIGKFWKEERVLVLQTLFFIIIFITSVVMSTNVSKLIYDIIPKSNVINFPWRFLTIATFAMSINAAIFIYSIRKFAPLGAVVAIVLALYFYWPYSKIVSWRYSATDIQYRGMVKTNINFLPDTEFLPKGARYLQLLEERGPAELHPFFEDETSESEINIQNNNNLIHTANITSSKPTTIRANTFYFSGWRLYIDNQESAINKDQYGLIKFTIQPSNHNIRLVFKNTLIRTVANTISIVTFLLFLSLQFKVTIKKLIRIRLYD